MSQDTEYTVEYAKSSRSSCRLTKKPIEKGALRIAEMVQSPHFDGLIPLWYNFEAFANSAKMVAEFKLKCKLVKNLDKIRPEDKERVLQLLGGEKKEDVSDEQKTLKDAFDAQQKEIWKLTDQLKKLDISILKSILQYNDQPIEKNIDDISLHIAQGMYFGKLPRCHNPECINNNYLVYSQGANVRCIGKTQWAKCDVKLPISKVTIEAWRFPPKVCPIKNWKFEKHDKVDYIENSVSTIISEDEKKKLESIIENNGEEIDENLPLSGCKISVSGKIPNYTIKSIKNLVIDNGGKYINNSSSLTHLITTKEEYNLKVADKIIKAIDDDVNIVTIDFVLKSIEKGSKLTKEEFNNGDFILSLSKKEDKKRKREEKVIEISPAKKRKIQIKGRAAVDEDCEIADQVHVYDDGLVVWSQHLTLTDVTSGINSFYILQLLQDDKDPSINYIFRKWGRTGTTIGGNKCDEYVDLANAKLDFSRIFEEKTGNIFLTIFEKKPGLFYPINVVYDTDISFNLSSYDGELSKQVADLIRLIFDVNTMKASMAEMEIDTEKLPLGNISSSSIDNGFSILGEIENAINKNASKSVLTTLSNKFYMLVPQTSTPLIDTKDLIKEKSELLGSLRDMAVAVTFMKDTSKEVGTHPIDSFYKQLNNEIIPLDRDSEEFKICQDYLLNTHAPTHSSYSFEVMEIFKVSRDGEDKSFEKWKNLPNHQLLWHGSRLSNWTGILSQGLRIAPPSAPVSGYMFGKAIYFANMSSKSANYCRTSISQNEGLLMLCQVPLGRSKEVYHADYHTPERLNGEGYNSLWGRGKTIPNSSEYSSLNLDGINVAVPKGSPKDLGVQSSLIYDEFTVYDESQVRSRYLLRVKFQYRTGFSWF